MNTAPFSILKTILTTVGTTMLASSAFGYGDEGHQTVGAIADRLLQHAPHAAAGVRALLGNETLEKAATWADDVKYHYDAHDPEMVAFVQANPHVPDNSGPHDHHAYHYTDIPIQETRYRASSAGAKDIDVIHMIANCIQILRGHDNATTNPTHISKKTALRLLVHFVGDIHQPLHVGAACFGPNATLVNPNTVPGSLADRGGNQISFHSTNLHGYWDNEAFRNAMAKAGAHTPGGFADFFVQHPPHGWSNLGSVTGWSVKWAGEILPVAAQAHSGLTFRTAPHGWNAHSDDLPAYDAWAADQVTTEIGRAGYRLAAVLRKIWP